MFKVAPESSRTHALLDKLEVSPKTDRVAGPLGPAQKKAARELAAQVGVSFATVESLVTGRGAAAGAGSAELKKLSTFLEGAFHRPGPQASPHAQGQISSLHQQALRAQKEEIGQRLGAAERAAAAFAAKGQDRALVSADRQLEAASRYLGIVANGRPGPARDRALGLAKTAVLTAQSELGKAKKLSPEAGSGPVQELQARVLQVFRELKSLSP